MSRPYISVDTMPTMGDPEWVAWVATNKLDRCYRLESIDGTLTQWVGSFYSPDADGRPYAERGEVVHHKRAVVTTPARREWVHL